MLSCGVAQFLDRLLHMKETRVLVYCCINWAWWYISALWKWRQGIRSPHSKFKVSLCHRRPCLKNWYEKLKAANNEKLYYCYVPTSFAYLLTRFWTPRDSAWIFVHVRHVLSVHGGHVPLSCIPALAFVITTPYCRRDYKTLQKTLLLTT